MSACENVSQVSAAHWHHRGSLLAAIHLSVHTDLRADMSGETCSVLENRHFQPDHDWSLADPRPPHRRLPVRWRGAPGVFCEIFIGDHEMAVILAGVAHVFDFNPGQ
jgi:hypothetical protein